MKPNRLEHYDVVQLKKTLEFYMERHPGEYTYALGCDDCNHNLRMPIGLANYVWDELNMFFACANRDHGIGMANVAGASIIINPVEGVHYRLLSRRS